MPYNRDLDELMRLAVEVNLRPQYRIFAEFAELRGQGVRRGALDKLRCFLDLATFWPFPERLVFVRWLLEKSRKFSDSSIVLPQVARERLVVPTVREWSEANSAEAEPWLWLGLLRCDRPARHLERALALDPSCDLARKTLIEWIISDIKYNQHHLPQFYIYDPRGDLKDLDQAESLIEGRAIDEWATEVQREITELRRLAAQWVIDHPRPGDFAVH